MKTKLFALLSTFALAMPATATPRYVAPGKMVNDPYFGWSRVETVRFCLDEVGVDAVDNLMTDTDLEVYEACMIEMT